MALALAAILTLLGWGVGAPVAPAVSVTAGPTTTVTPDTALEPDAIYSFGRYRTGGNESVTSWSITFPAGTVVSEARAASATVTISGQTVTVQPSEPIPPKTLFTADVEGIGNPHAGTYNAGRISFQTVDKQGRTRTESAATGSYTIAPASPHLSFTLATPGPGRSIDFGDMEPGTTTGPVTVSLEVNSSTPYTVTRSVSGSSEELGLRITGSITSGLQPAGSATFEDLYTISPSYDATPGVPLSASVLYTVVQQ